ncbi:hypothetical protein AMJ49_04580 [Parcubacteria bacterium DG_74_2]|nr:MAG: hypothetical protein AMJ49_04580 [Parcubacteria bacterium DG_74_2]
MNLWFLFSLINGITATLLGFSIYSKDKKNLINKTFLLMNLGIIIWSFSYCKWLLVEEREIALFWSRVLNFGATLIPIFYLHHVLSFLNLVGEKRRLLITGYLMTFIFSVFSFTPYYIKSVKQVSSFPYWPQAGPLYICFLFLGYFGLIGYGVYQLLKIRKVSSGDKIAQIDYIVLASVIGFVGGATNFPLMFGVSLLPPIGQPLVAFYVLIVAFALVKYHLYAIRIILTEFLVGVIGLVLLVQALTAPTLGWKIFGFVLLATFAIMGYQLINYTYLEIRRREEVEKISKTKSEFLSIASHQLRTPLSAIKGYLSMVMEGTYGGIPERAKKAIENVYKSNERLVKLVNAFLDVTRIEMGALEINFERSSIEDVISEVISEIEIAAKKKNLYLKFEKPERALPKISIDEEKIKEVILNIIDNAIKYTQKGGITISTKILNSKFQILIKDTGEGLTKEEASRLFESFSRGTAGARFWTEGAGLGLYVSRKFVELHGGKIWAESPGKDKGSTFYIELPVK